MLKLFVWNETIKFEYGNIREIISKEKLSSFKYKLREIPLWNHTKFQHIQRHLSVELCIHKTTLYFYNVFSHEGIDYFYEISFRYWNRSIATDFLQNFWIIFKYKHTSNSNRFSSMRINSMSFFSQSLCELVQNICQKRLAILFNPFKSDAMQWMLSSFL